MTQGVGHSMAKGAVWMVLFRLSDRTLGLVNTIVLARLLLPADFGLVAMAMSLIAAVELLNSFSFDVALIQNQKAGREQYDTAWTYNVIFGVVTALIMAALAYPMSVFYREPRLAPVVFALAIGRILLSWSNIGIVDFRKGLMFDREYRFLVFRRVASVAITIAMAVYLRTYWALVGGILLGNLFGLVLSYQMHPYRPRLTLVASRELFQFSSWMMVSNLLYFLWNRTADFTIGRLAGTGALGLYKISYELANLPTSELSMPINRAILPGYAKMASDVKHLRQGYLKVLAVVALVVIPAGTGIAMLADLIVNVVYGQRWLAGIPLVRILAIAGMVMALQGNASMVLLAQGRVKVMSKLTSLNVAILIPLLVWQCAVGGAKGAAIAVLATAILMMPLNYIYVARAVGVQLVDICKTVWRPTVGAMTMAIFLLPGYELFTIIWDRLPQMAALLILTTTGAAIYTGTVLSLWSLVGCPAGGEAYLIAQVGARLSRFRR